MTQLQDYLLTFDQIVISTYKDQVHELLHHSELVNNHQITWVLSDRAFPQGVDWYGNVWHQCKTTLAGLNQVHCDHVIKHRTDESWSNLHRMRQQMEQCSQYVSINIYFKRWNVFPFHIGDHLFGGNTLRLRRGFQVLRQLLTTDQFQNTRFAAEQKICASLLMADGETPRWQDCRDQLQRYWQVIDARLLEPFWFNAPSVGTFGSSLDQVAQCEQHNPTVELHSHIAKYLEP